MFGPLQPIRAPLRGHSSAWFPLLSACRFAEFDTSVICHVLQFISALFWLISITRYVLSLQVFAFEGQNMMFTQLRTCYLHSTCILWWRARLLLELFASTVGRFLSRISYLPLYVFLRRRRSFTSRKLYASAEKFLCFLQLSDRACFWSSMNRFIPPLIVLLPQDSSL